MQLSPNEVKEKVQKRPMGRVLNEAKQHQDRVRLHSLTRVEPNRFYNVNDNIHRISNGRANGNYRLPALYEFESFVKQLIPAPKYRLWRSLLTFPLRTNSIVDTCFNRLSKIFNARNANYNYKFKNSEDAQDWEVYRKEELKEPQVWQTTGWDNLRINHNSFIVIDMEQGLKDKPNPYFYWLSIDNVIDYDIDNEGNVLYIIYKQSNGRLVVIDDKAYQIYEYDENKTELSINQPTLVNTHNLGYCPVSFFWNDSLSLENRSVKKSPISEELSSLDWYLFWYHSKQHLDLYGAYPIYSGYKRNCNYSTEDGDYCDNGYIRTSEGSYINDSAGNPSVCPVCGKSVLAGAGTYMEIPAPTEKDSPDLRNPIQVLGADTDSLNYNVEELNRRRKDIITSIVGIDAEMQNKQAINDKQVESNFESKGEILNRLKTNFEIIQTFVDDTICKLRYGDSFVDSSINYGTDFYVADVAELRERYKLAKEAGVSETELDALQNSIIETEYKNNPSQLQRIKLLFMLEPYRHMTINEMIILFDKGLITDEDLKLKLNFSNFIERFERENINIVDFGTKTTLENKLKTINNKLKDYVREQPTTVPSTE